MDLKPSLVLSATTVWYTQNNKDIYISKQIHRCSLFLDKFLQLFTSQVVFSQDCQVKWSDHMKHLDNKIKIILKLIFFAFLIMLFG